MSTTTATAAAPSSTATAEIVMQEEPFEMNKEFEMPSWPLPSTWTDASAVSSAGVVLYGSPLSPPTNKIMTILDFHQIKYTMNPKVPKESPYKKMPILVIGGKQINDSFIIARVLASILDKAPYTESELQGETMSTRGLMLALEAEVAGSGEEMRKCGRAAGGCIGCVLSCLSCCVPICGFSKKIKGAFPGESDISVREYSEKFAGILGTNQYFHGQEIGVSDLSLFGVLRAFAKADNAALQVFMSNEIVGNWYGRVKEQFDAKNKQ